jgi:large subunit ribosomal protein L31e
MASLTRNYTINLRHELRECPRYKKTKKAVSEVKKFILKHMKAKTVKLGDNLNRHLWQNGIQNPPIRFKVSLLKEDDVVYAELEGHDPALIKGMTKEAREKAIAEEEKKSKKTKTEEKEVKEALGSKEEKKE